MPDYFLLRPERKIRSPQYHYGTLWGTAMEQGSKSSSSGYSPPIRITLEVSNEQFAVAELGDDFLVLRSARKLEPSSGTVTVDVDGRRVIHQVRLPNGIDPDLEDQPLVHLNIVPLAKAV